MTLQQTGGYQILFDQFELLEIAFGFTVALDVPF